MKFQSIKQKLEHFFEHPIHPRPLGLFRVLIAIFVLVQAAFWYHDWLAFFAEDAWLQWEISEAIVPSFTLHISDVHQWLSSWGFTPANTAYTLFWVYVISALGMLLGLFTRFWCILTWFCHYIIMVSIDMYVYGVDIFLQIALFYLAIMPVHKAWSLDVWLRNKSAQPTWAVTLSLRVLQIHLCLAYLSAGYEKMLSAEWWNGNVLWRSLVQPDFSQYDFTWLAQVPWLVMALSWFTMFIEVLYGIAMWIPKVRVYWLAGILSLHLGIGLFLGLWLFGLIMIILSVAAFGLDVWKDIKTMTKPAKAIAQPSELVLEVEVG